MKIKNIKHVLVCKCEYGWCSETTGFNAECMDQLSPHGLDRHGLEEVRAPGGVHAETPEDKNREVSRVHLHPTAQINTSLPLSEPCTSRFSSSFLISSVLKDARWFQDELVSLEGFYTPNLRVGNMANIY